MRYSELDGEALLYDPIRRALHRLSPAAAVVWHRFDGRPLGEIGWADPALGAIIELARRLRALGLVEDAGPVAGPSPSLNAMGEIGHPGPIGWPGRLVEQPTGLTLELTDATTARPLVPVELSSAPDGRAELNPAGGEPSIAAVVIGPVVIESGDSDRQRPLSGVEAAQAIVEMLPAGWFGPDDALDRIADLVERVPVFDTRDPDTDSAASPSG